MEWPEWSFLGRLLRVYPWSRSSFCRFSTPRPGLPIPFIVFWWNFCWPSPLKITPKNNQQIEAIVWSGSQNITATQTYRLLPATPNSSVDPYRAIFWEIIKNKQFILFVLIEAVKLKSGGKKLAFLNFEVDFSWKYSMDDSRPKFANLSQSTHKFDENSTWCHG